MVAVGRSAILLTAGLLVSQVLVAVREMFVAAQTGTSSGLDALLVGVVLPIAVGGVLSSGTAVALVPVYLTARASRRARDAQRFAGVVFAWVALGAAGVWLLLTLVAGPLVGIMGSGLGTDGQAEAATFLRLAAPSVLASAMYGILAAVCQAESWFRPIAVASVTNALTAMAVVLVLWDRIGLTAYAISVVAGPLVAVIVLGVAMFRRSIFPVPRLRAEGMPTNEFLRHAVPLTVSSSILQIGIVIDIAVASVLQPGSVSALRFGQLLINVPVGALSVAWNSAIYPALVGSTLTRDPGRLAWVTSQGLRYAFALFVPLASLTMAVAPLAVAVAYGRGLFTGMSIDATAWVVLGLAPTIALSMATPVLVGALNARRQGTYLLAAGVLNVSLKAVFDIVLGYFFGILGIALASSLMLTVVFLFFASRVSQLEPSFHLRPILRTILKAVVAAAPGVIVTAALVWGAWPERGLLMGLLILAGVSLATAASYLVMAKLIGLHEPGNITDTIKREARQRLRPT